MPKMEKTTTITVDDVLFAVEKMDPQLKQMIAYMDEWRQKEADVATDLLMVRSALRDLQNSVYVALKKQQEEAAAAPEAAADFVPVEDGAGTTEEPQD